MLSLDMKFSNMSTVGKVMLVRVVVTWIIFSNSVLFYATKSLSIYEIYLRATNCDAVFKSDIMKNGSLSSPEYPGTYSPRTTCRYEFQGRGKERVQIVFTDFSLYHPGDESRE
ncbi:hypothetical protein M8J75_007004 [Diaphorina citri]|nr:hypothetical protein M8J75_007004 [Diaphorina citri]